MQSPCFSHQAVLRGWDWQAEMAQCHGDTGAHQMTLLWEVRKLFAEQETLHINRKAPPAPCFQWAIIIMDTSALLRLQKLVERQKRDNPQKEPASAGVCAGSCARREGKGKAQGELNHAAIFHRDQAFSGTAFTCTTFLAEKSFHGELAP